MKKIIIRDNANYEFNIKVDTELTITAESLEVSDGFHTMDELYEHRMALCATLFNTWQGIKEKYPNAIDIEVMKSRLHSDGTMYEGYFIVMALTERGQISYHFEINDWYKFVIPEVERCPTWDKHTSDDVINRLLEI